MRLLIVKGVVCVFALTSVLVADRAATLAKRAKTVHTNTCEDVSDEDTCHSSYAEGCTTAVKANTYDAFLSFLKNTTPAPQNAQPQQIFTSLEDFQSLDGKADELGLGKQRQKTFAPQLATLGQGNFYGVVGYLYYAIPGGKETCNCKLTNPSDRDFHLGVGFDPSLASQIADGTVSGHKPTGSKPSKAEQTSIVIEMTPHYRAKYHSNWTLPKLENLVGRQVKAIGQLLVDNEHNDSNQNCAFDNAVKSTCWRGSTWEIHPVTRFFVCTAANPCSADSDEGWTELDVLADQ